MSVCGCTSNLPYGGMDRIKERHKDDPELEKLAKKVEEGSRLLP